MTFYTAAATAWGQRRGGSAGWVGRLMLGAGEGMLGFLDLFKTPNMRKKTLIIYYLWFASTFVYYGLTLNSNGFGASLFVSFMIGKGDSLSNMLYHFSSISSVYKIFSNSHWVTNGHAWDFADFKSRKKIVIDIAVFNLWSGTVAYNGNTKVSCYL